MFYDVVIKPFGLGFPLHSLVFKRKKIVNETIKYFIPGVDNVIGVIENKRAILRHFFQSSSKLFFILVLDVTVGDCCSTTVLCTAGLFFRVAMVGR